MKIQFASEALFIACEMERGAVQLYERALQVMEETGRKEEELYALLRDMLTDEQRHLQQFQEMYTAMDAETERQMMLSAIADGILFEGGLMGAARAGLLKDVEAMLLFAEKEESKAIDVYTLMAEQATDPLTKRALSSIAAEENHHLNEIQARRIHR